MYATDLNLTDGLIPKDAATIIRADRVVISQAINTLRRNITIFARKIEAADGTAIIDTEGPSAFPTLRRLS